MKRFSSHWLLASTLLLGLACSGGEPQDTGVAMPDTGVRADSGIQANADSGTQTDSGMQPADAGPPPEPDDVSANLETVRASSNMIALGGAVVDTHGAIAIGATGTRTATVTDAVELGDRWHLGSDTKAMCATLAAVMVEEGLISWDTTVGEVFIEFAGEIDPGFANVTLVHLFTHRSGLPPALSQNRPDLWNQLWANVGTLREQRTAFARAILSSSPFYTPESQHLYANSGYIVAGTMLEHVADTVWEDLMREKLFMPLGMDGCGFGSQETEGTIDAPLGHIPGNPPTPVRGFTGDNPPALGPAGTAHCPLADWSKFIALHLRGAQGDTELLPKVQFDRLQAGPGYGKPENYDYAFGWIIVERPWAGGKTLTHDGTNTYNYATAWLAPLRGKAYLGVTNIGGSAAQQATDMAVVTLLGLYPADQ